MYKYSLNLLPECIAHLYLRNDSIHEHNTRGCHELTGACPGICKRGGPKSESLFFFFFFFFFCFSLFQGGGPAQKLAEKKTFSTKKVAKYR